MKRRNKGSEQKERLGEANKVMTHNESEKQAGFSNGRVADQEKLDQIIAETKPNSKLNSEAKFIVQSQAQKEKLG